VRYAAFPGLAIGFLVGWVLTLANDPIARIEGGIWIATAIGCPLNAWLMGFPKSGCLATVVAFFWDALVAVADRVAGAVRLPH
jgi:hypothetical protein